MRHPHADVIKEWAEDTSRVLQFKSPSDNEWTIWNLGVPTFHKSYEWRFSPVPKPDIDWYYTVDNNAHVNIGSGHRLNIDNLKLTFDGETGKLKAAEVIE